MVKPCCYCGSVVDAGVVCVKCMDNPDRGRPGFRHDREMLTIVTRQYAQGNGLRIDLVDKEGAPYATLTKNPAPHSLAEGCVLVKTYAENEEVAASALASGLFTGARVSAGYSQLEVWRYNIPSC